MNLVYIHTHDAGRCFEPYGYPVKSPCLMKFADTATVFRNAHCAAPTCSPSRAAMMTGASPHSVGLLGLAHHGFNGGFNMLDYTKHLVQFLGKSGYETVLCGIQHEACDDEKIGYQKKLNEVEHTNLFGRTDYQDNIGGWDLHNAELCAEYLNKRSSEQPFFLSFGMYSSHRPYPTHLPEINPSYLKVPNGQPDTPEVRLDTAEFNTALQYVDKAAGIVLQALESQKYRNDTVIVFSVDHGLSLPGQKCNLNDKGTGIALMLSYPGNQSAGEVSDALVSQIDLFPTFCDLLNIKIPNWVEGTSLLPVMQKKSKLERPVFSEITYHGQLEPARAVRTERYKYIRYFQSPCKVEMENCDPSASKRALMVNGWVNWDKELVQLYDLGIDPDETKNLTGNSMYAQTEKEMEQLLFNWMERTNDPVLTEIPARPITENPEFKQFAGSYMQEIKKYFQI